MPSMPSSPEHTTPRLVERYFRAFVPLSCFAGGIGFSATIFAIAEPDVSGRPVHWVLMLSALTLAFAAFAASAWLAFLRISATGMVNREGN